MIPSSMHFFYALNYVVSSLIMRVLARNIGNDLAIHYFRTPRIQEPWKLCKTGTLDLCQNSSKLGVPQRIDTSTWFCVLDSKMTWKKMCVRSHIFQMLPVKLPVKTFRQINPLTFLWFWKLVSDMAHIPLYPYICPSFEPFYMFYSQLLIVRSYDKPFILTANG